MKAYVIGIILLSALMISCLEKNKNSSFEKEISVRVIETKPSFTTDKQNYVGTVEETFSTSLSFEVPGNLASILVDEGRRVYKGQLLATLNKTNLQNTYNAAKSGLVQAEDAYRRIKQLHDSNSLPEVKWIEIQTTLEQAKSAEAIARKNLNDCNLYAPISGVITQKHVEAGSNIMPGMPVFKLVTVDKVKVKIAVPEKEISDTRQGQEAVIKVMALGNRIFKGKISEKNVVANPVSHTYEVKMELNNPTGELMPGMVCNVNINNTKSTSQLIVPNNAIQIKSSGESFVWIAKEGIAFQRIVTTGALTNEGVSIDEGLDYGEQVIVEGNQKISEGMKIIIR